MTHTITGKLNKAANQHPGANGVTFFIELGEQNYNHLTKQKEWTNYSAAIFAKDAQIQFYASSLVAGAIVSVTGSGILLEMPTDPQYKPRLKLCDAKVAYVHNPGVPMPQAVGQQVGYQPQQPHAPQQPHTPQAAPQMAPQQHPTGQQGDAPIYDPDLPF